MAPAPLFGFDPSIGAKSLSHVFKGLFNFYGVFVVNFWVLDIKSGE